MTTISAWLEGGSPVVLFLGDEVGDYYEQWLVSHAEHAWAPELPETVTGLSQRLATVVVDTTLPAEQLIVFKEALAELRPWCQLVLVTDTNQFRKEISPDRTVSTADDEQVQETIQESVQRATFEAALHEFFRIQARLVALAASPSTGTSEEATRLKQLQQTVKVLLPELRAGLKMEQFEATAHAARIRRKYVSEESPKPAVVRKTTSKYLPDSCPTCNEPWQPSWSPTPAGYVPLGSFVYRCLPCGAIYKTRRRTRRGSSRQVI